MVSGKPSDTSVVNENFNGLLLKIILFFIVQIFGRLLYDLWAHAWWFHLGMRGIGFSQSPFSVFGLWLVFNKIHIFIFYLQFKFHNQLQVDPCRVSSISSPNLHSYVFRGCTISRWCLRCYLGNSRPLNTLTPSVVSSMLTLSYDPTLL